MELRKVLLTIIVVMLALSMPLSTLATVPVSSGFESPKGTVTVVMHYEDASDVSRVQAMLQQDFPALEYVFNRLQREGKLDRRFPRLVIGAVKYFAVDNRFETVPTVLSSTSSAKLVCNFPGQVQFEPRELGPAYVIWTTTGLLNYRDIVAMLLLMGSLNDETPSITIGSEQELDKGKALPGFTDLVNLELKQVIKQEGPGGLTLTADWKSDAVHGPILQYFLMNEAGNVVATLMPVSAYVGQPVWPPAERQDWQGRLMAYASPEKAVVYDLAKDKHHTLELNFTSENPRMREILRHTTVGWVGFAMHATENKVFVFPFGSMLSLHVVYSINLDSNEWRRELEGYSLFEQVYRFEQVLEPKPKYVMRSKLGYDFVPAIPERRMRNVDLATAPIKGEGGPALPRQPVPPAEEPPAGGPPVGTGNNEPSTDKPLVRPRNYAQAMWLLLPLVAAGTAVTIMFVRRRRKVAPRLDINSNQ